MSRTLSALLLLVLSADALLVFLIPVMVYSVTASLAWSGLAYATAWLPRILVTPLVGASIDRWGVRRVSVVSDLTKLSGCLLVAAVLWSPPAAFVITVAGGLLGGLVAIGNAQSLIAYEKMIALASTHIDRDVNVLSRIDQLAMIVGPMAGFIGYSAGVVPLLALVGGLYALNAGCFMFGLSIPARAGRDARPVTTGVGGNLRLIFSTPVLMSCVVLAVGNNAFDGLVEAGAVTLIDRAMQLPIHYFAFVDICAGACGVGATLLYPQLSSAIPPLRLFVMAALVAATASALMVLAQRHLGSFLALYAVNIAAKVFMNNFTRGLRIRIVPVERLAGVSSLLVLLNQAVLPVVGLGLYAIGGRLEALSALMALAIGVTLVGAYLITRLHRTPAALEAPHERNRQPVS